MGTFGDESLVPTGTFFIDQPAGMFSIEPPAEGVVTFRVLRTSVYRKSPGSLLRCQPSAIAVDFFKESSLSFLLLPDKRNKVNEIMRRRLSSKLRCYQLITCVGTYSRMLCSEWNQDELVEKNEFIDY
ncbi:hypothetical protein EAG_11008 [Camponotus floridanus]|uniref:Uncharacterized protein n=1 Tax=Camponotus floridanus TaxID=104421 RepID=E2AJ74_CAMFO|nr:hypothetical protein EAG_11008 [Camponotus floridanus]